MSLNWSMEEARSAVERRGWLVAVLCGADIGSCTDERLQRLAMVVLVMAERIEELEQARNQ